MYEKANRKFSMIAYNQISGKITGTDEILLKSCTRRMSDSIEKRFCFDLTAENRPGVVFTFQALSEEDRRLWLDAMDGREPVQDIITKSFHILVGAGAHLTMYFLCHFRLTDLPERSQNQKKLFWTM